MDIRAEIVNNPDGKDFSKLDLQNSDLSYLNLEGFNFSGCNLEYSDFRGAILIGANLREANLKSANLSFSDLSGAYLSYANLSHVDLIDANLSGANLTRANLTASRFSGANLASSIIEGATLTRVNLSGSKGLNTAKTFLDKLERVRDGYIVYKIFNLYKPSPNYWDGDVIEEVVNLDPATSCGCGINVTTYERCLNESGLVWRCLVRFEDLVDCVVPYQNTDIMRCGRITKLEVVRH